MVYRFALIGCGQIAPRHAREMARVGTINAVCDIDKERADKLAALYNCKAFYNLDELLLHTPDFDIASICTPNYLHANHTISCLQNGLHVLCEKPMAISVEDGKKMLKAAAQSKRRLIIVQQNRFNPPVQVAKALLDQGKLGKIHAFQVNCFWNRTASYYNSPWKGKKALDGGILYTQFSHFIDILIWFLGEAALINNFKDNFLLKNSMETEDTGFILMRLKSGAIGTINYTVTTFSKNMEGSFTLFGEKGTLKIGGQYLNTLEYFNVQDENAPVLPVHRDANDYGSYQGSMSNHDLIYDNLTRSLNNIGHNVVEAGEALKTIVMIEQIYQAGKF